MKLYITFFICLFLSYEGNAVEIAKSEFYIFEYYPKMANYALIEFVAPIDSNRIQQIGYKINYKKNKITNITPQYLEYKGWEQNCITKSDSNIYVEFLKKTCFTSKNFKENKTYPDEVYKMICEDFLDIPNREKVLAIEKLINHESK